jgi:hypothetical protein
VNRWSSNLLTIAFCLIVAGLGTKFALVQADARKVAAAPKPSPSSTPAPTPTPTPVPTPSATPVATPTPVAERKAVTNGFVHMRAAKSTSSAIVVDLQGGTVVTLGSDETSLWQEVYYGAYHGYIWKGYLNY